MNTIFIRVDSFGKINELDIKSLKHYNFLRNIDNLKYIEDLYGRFEASDTRVDYSNLATAIKRHRKNIILRNRILELIPYSMIYSENTLPIYGYIRSKSFIRTFNKELDINLELDNVHKIMNKDYSKVKKIK